MSELAELDAWELAARVRGGEISPSEVVDASLERIAARDGELGAVWEVTEERARSEAAALEHRLSGGEEGGPLAGVPVGWKDLIDTGGIRTTYGSAVFREHVPARDADVVSAFAAAGAICVAKLSLHELAWGTTNQNPHYGACRNPHDTSRVPGGSSGGSAVALAAGMVALAPGTDTGGSIRIPASCCGVVGLKPTFGRVSLDGVRPLCPSFDHCGPLARTVRDCALSLEVLAGASANDPRTAPVPVARYTEALERGVEGLVVGVAERFFFEHASEDVAAPARRAVERLAGAGATVVEVDLGWPPSDLLRIDIYLPEEAASLGDLWPDRAAELGEDVRRDARAAERLGAIEFAAAQQARLAYRARLEALVERDGIDLVASPTLAFAPPEIGVERVPFAGRGEHVTTAMCELTGPFNVLGWPAISVPCGRDALGLPAGLQLAARPWREADCLAAAAVVEKT